jgi:hypothetical protein
VTAILILAQALALAPATSPPGRLRLDSTSLRADIRPVAPWCRGHPRAELTLTNTTEKTIWVALERPVGREMSWDHYSYFDDHGGGATRGIADGDTLSFLRSGRATRLDPRASAKWVLRLGSEALHPGRAELSVQGPVEGTMQLDDPHVTLYEFDAKMSVVLSHSGRCYRPRGG